MKDFRLVLTNESTPGQHTYECSGYQQSPLWLGNNGNLTLAVHFRGFERIEGESSWATLGWVIIYGFKFGRTEKHSFTITTHMSQHVEFSHPLIFCSVSPLPLITRTQVFVHKLLPCNVVFKYSYHIWLCLTPNLHLACVPNLKPHNVVLEYQHNLWLCMPLKLH